MAIYVITGKPRHGKTYYLSTLIYKMLKHGERVFSNIKLNLGKGALKLYDETIVGDLYKPEDINNENKILFYWHNIHEWEHMGKGNIIVDEGTRYFNARQWALLSEDTEIKLQQHGKDDLDVWVTTQHYSRIDITLRILVERFFIVKTLFGNPNNKKPFFGIKIFKIIGVELEDIEDYYYSIKHPEQKIELDVSSKLKLFRKKFAISYDTLEKVGKTETMPLVHKTRTCPICGKIMITHL